MLFRLRNRPRQRGRSLLFAAVLALVACVAGALFATQARVAHASAATPTSVPHAASSLPAIKHVWVIVEENESAATTFGAGSPAPYLSQTLKSEGAYLPNYYGVGHSSLDNYIAMVSGQAPNSDTSADCGTYAPFTEDTMGSYGQETGNMGIGCVYPSDVPTLMSQMDSAGLTWRAYEDDMPAACEHPAVGAAENNNGEGTVKYATRHNPFVYFSSVIDNTSECDADDVNATQLTTDLQSVATTPNFSFITPDVCDDGHDATGSNCPQGGLTQADSYLQQVVPEITSSPAYQQDGLLMIIFDEAGGSDASDCCGEIPGPGEAEPGGTGPGGGDTGAVFLSPFITAGTVTSTAYNHYTMLGSVENIFGLCHLGYAGLPGETYFGSDIFGGTYSGGGPNACVTSFGTTNTTSTTGTTSTPSPPNTSTPSTTTSTTPTTVTSASVAPAIAAPKDSRVSLTPASFAPTGTGTARQHHGTTIVYTDSQAATTTLTVTRQVAGYRVGTGTCRALAAGRKRPAHSEACTATETVGRVTHKDKVGVNRVTFTGRLNGRALAKGTYTLTVRPTLSSHTGQLLSVRFRVI